MKLISQSFCFEGEGFEDKNFKAIPDIDKERLKIIFDIAKELEPRSFVHNEFDIFIHVRGRYDWE